ncbi:MAG TPA: PAS domain S-box protein [Thermoanaerobaculia bacterium]
MKDEVPAEEGRDEGAEVRAPDDPPKRLQGAGIGLGQSVRMQAHMLDQIGQAVIATDPDGKVIYANRAAGELHAWPPEEMLGQSILSFTSDDASTQGKAGEILACLRQGRSWTGEMLVRSRDGRVFPVLLTNSSLFDEQGEVIGLIGVSVDFSAQKQAEEALERRERDQRDLAGELEADRAKLLTAQAVAKLGSWETDLATLKVIWSAETHRIFGTNPEQFEPTHERFMEFVHPDERNTVGEAFVRSVQMSTPSALEHRIVLHDGRIKYVDERWRVFRDDEGRPVRAIGTAHDITERKLAEQELARTHRALQMLSSCNEALIRAESEQRLLDQICRIAVEGGGYLMAWVGYAPGEEGGSIQPRAHAGFEQGYLSEVTISASADEPSGRGPAARTLRGGMITVCENIQEDAGFFWKEAALRRGFRSVICLPLRDSDTTFGFLALYSGEIRQVSEDEIRLLRELADDLAFGIVNLRSRIERERIETAVLTLAAGFSPASGKEFFEHMTGSMARALGAQAGFVTRPLPGQPGMARTRGVTADGRTIAPFDHALSDAPCERLIDRDECIVPFGLRELYPMNPAQESIEAQAFAGRRLLSASGQPMGCLFVLFRERLKPSSVLSSTLQIFATRAAAELERQQADAQIREQASMLDAATDAIFVRDIDHRITYWNRSAERLYGWTAAEAMGHFAFELLHYGDPEAFQTASRAVIETGQWSGELKKRSKAGAQLSVESRWTLLRDDLGRPGSILAINTDVTERRKLETQFLRAQRIESIGTLAGGIAHDLNNLLAPIVMGVSILKRFEEREKMLAIIGNIERSAKRGTDLVKQVLSFGRGVEGSRVPVRLESVISEIESIVTSTFPKNITLEQIVAEDLRLIVGDATQLNQVLLNLCVNARDAMPDGGRLTLSARNVEIDEQYVIMNKGKASAGCYVLLEVADDGHGMSREVMDRAFDPFFSTKEAGKGTGLGLSTVNGIVRSHGGFVNVHSEAGMGSVFRVYLPAEESSPAAGIATAATETIVHGKGELILIVDDEPSILSVTSQTLETFGYRTMVAEDGAEAIGLYAMRRDEIDLVITDMMMPVMDGPALVAALYRINPDVMIIGASGLGTTENVARARHSGVTNFLAKPFSADVMLTMIRAVLDGEDPPASGAFS